MLSTRFTPLRIRVNCLAPGLFPSEINDVPGGVSSTDPENLRFVQADQFKAMPEGAFDFV